MRDSPTEMGSGLRLVDKIFSKSDRTVKFVFLSNGQVIEFSYIDKQDGKDIICAPTQTACKLGCKFCFLSDYDFAVRNLAPEEITDGVQYIVRNLKLLEREGRNDVLLVSYMGCGEPLCNVINLMYACESIRVEFASLYRVVRFAVASLIPTPSRMRRFISEVHCRKLPVKFHLSLHSPFDACRSEMMPGASPVQDSVDLVRAFTTTSGNAAEIHYALIANVNDRDEDVAELMRLLKGSGISIKFLAYNEKPSIDFKPSERVAEIRTALEREGITTEFYNPPGSDIGSSCGQFLMDYYVKYNTKPLVRRS